MKIKAVDLSVYGQKTSNLSAVIAFGNRGVFLQIAQKCC